jgi:signal transduction histidine kinase/DNA-binding response OmpR family regulator
LLEYAGHSVSEAADGAEALERVRADQPDLVITDILMPRMDGFEFVRQLRSEEAIAGTPVIFYTATYLEREANTLAQACGVSIVLAKPADPDLILKTIAGVLDGKTAVSTVSSAPAPKRSPLEALNERFKQKPGELETSSSRLAALIDLGLALTAERDPARLLQTFCDVARLIVGPKHATVYLLDEDGQSFSQVFASTSEVGNEGAPVLSPALLKKILTSRRPVRLHDFTKGEPTSELPSEREAKNPFLGVPISSPNVIYGLLCFTGKFDAEDFSEEEERLALTLAAQAASAIENARLYDEIQRHAAKLQLEIAERKQAEEALKKSEEQFRQSQKLEAVGRLAGGIAHDFNNVLTIIGGYNELVQDELGEDNRVKKEIEGIGKAVQRAASLTRQLMAFSRKQVLEMQIVDLNAIVSNIDEMLHPLLGEDIELLTVPGKDLGKIKADRGQLEQVVMNLAVNARDAMPQGGRLTIITANAQLDEDYARDHFSVQPGAYIMLAVNDTGCGMDAETRAHLFEPFFTTKELGKGTGLGLSTVYGIVKQSGGHIWVYSEPDVGTTFKIYLPRVEDAADPKPQAKPLKGTYMGSETILLVEDQKEVRELACRILAKNGYAVLEAGGGAEAIEISERHKGPIHLLVSDVVMPQISGRDLADRLVHSRPEMRRLFMSGYTDDAILRHGILDEGVSFLEKPFTSEALARKVREVLDT